MVGFLFGQASIKNWNKSPTPLEFSGVFTVVLLEKIWVSEPHFSGENCSSDKNRKSSFRISKANAHLACSSTIKCSPGLLIWRKVAHLANLLKIVISLAHLKKECSSALLIWKKCAHFCCSANKKCSSFMLIYKKNSHLAWSMCLYVRWLPVDAGANFIICMGWKKLDKRSIFIRQIPNKALPTTRFS